MLEDIWNRLRQISTAIFSGGVFKSAFGVEAAKGTPALLGSAATALTQNFWIGLATLVYIVVQIAYLLRKWHREETDWRGTKKPKKPKSE